MFNFSFYDFIRFYTYVYKYSNDLFAIYNIIHGITLSNFKYENTLKYIVSMHVSNKQKNDLFVNTII